MLLRGQALEAVGLMDERFFMYGEDLDLCLRFRGAGWQVVYFPEVRILHHKGASTRKSTDEMIREFYRSMDLFHQKHFAASSPRLVNVGVRLAVRLGCVTALARNALRSPQGRTVGSA